MLVSVKGSCFRTLFFYLLATVGLPHTAFANTEAAHSYVQKAEELKLYEDREWLNLGHYRKATISRLAGRWVSEADGANFFIAPKGRRDPRAELKATIEGFFSAEPRTLIEPHPKQTVYCQFPARWRWLSKKLGIKQNEIPKQVCPQFEEFRTRLSAKSATLVFSSFYMNNPSSTFGHSLLRVNKTVLDRKKDTSQLLDTGVNFAANPTTTNPVLYAFFGMVGFFPGTFAAMPYFYKVREYNDFDSRDLWEYDLSLTEEQTDMLVAHIWEVAFTYFDYYFFTENCSYHMLTLIEVASPGNELVKKLPYWVIPSDTIKAAWNSPGLVKDVHYRPSIHTQLKARLDLLSHKGQVAYEARTKDFNPEALPADLSLPEKAGVLDALIDKFDLHNFSELIQDNKAVQNTKNKLLIARSRVDVRDDVKVAAPPLSEPHLSHNSSRLGYTHLIDDRGNNGYEVSDRFALHDLTDALQGYPRYGQIEFFKFTGRGSYQTGEFDLQNADFFSVEILTPFKMTEPAYTWRGRVSIDRLQDVRCKNRECLAGTAGGSVGMAFSITSAPEITPYVFLGANMRTSPRFLEEKFSLDGGPGAGLRVVLTDTLLFRGEAQWVSLLGEKQELFQSDSRLKWTFTRNWALEVGHRREYSGNLYLSSLYYYF